MSDKPSNPWQRKQDGPPDFDKVLKSFLTFGGKKNSSSPSSPSDDSRWWQLVLALIVVTYGFSGLYVVHEPEKAVITRFGAVSHIESAGLHWRFRGIDDVYFVDTQSIDSFQKTSMMLTKDENIVAASFEIQYRRSDPVRYLFADENAIQTLKQLAESSIRDIIGHSYLEDILTTGKDKITQDILRLIQSSLQLYDIGLEVTDVNVAKLQPPPDVQEAFNDVIKAREDEQALQNKAKRYRETHIPIAKGQAERIMFEADTFYKQQITKAQAETQAFEMVLKEHQAAPDILKARLYYEMIDDIYSKNPKILLDADVQSPIIYTSPAPVEPVKTAVQSPVYTKALTKDKK